MLAGAASGRFDGSGALMGLGAAVTYTGYILVGDRLAADITPLALAALVCTGATGTFAIGGIARGGPDLGFAPAGWVWLARSRWSARWPRSCCSSPAWPGSARRSPRSCPSWSRW